MRMANYGFEVLRTYFYRKNFYFKRSFQIGKRGGGRVRFFAHPRTATPSLLTTAG